MPTRRSFLLTAATGATSSLLASENRDWIDAHVHVWPALSDRYPVADGVDATKMKPASFTPEVVLGHARPEGVSRMVLIQMSYYRTDNRYMLDAIAAHSGVFRGVAIVDELRPDLAEVVMDLRSKGVRGFRISPGSKKPEEWLGSSGMRSLWKIAAAQKMAICPLVRAEVLPALDGMCEELPETTVVVDHFGLVGVKGTPTAEDVLPLTRLARHANTHVKTSAFYALGLKKVPYTDLGTMIRACRDAFGAHRLMWATDCPYQVQNGHSYRDSIALIRDRLDFLTQAEKIDILRSTAERVFFA
ncbi:MAG: amidohydrolase [Verrucomicrobiaceae bacterium]|nr:amidohydrolase [Verrucomicrobiaceae bacterium]